MPEPLKNQFGPDVPSRLAENIVTVWPQFSAEQFISEALHGYDELELMPRGRHLAQMLHRHLPNDYERAIEVLLASLGPILDGTEQQGMTPFFYMPHTFFVAEYGLDHFEVSMRAQYELAQRFTAEFSIRPFLVRHQEATLRRLNMWTQDANVHVRRLVSEGTRPRLPWAMRLPEFQKDPGPILSLLEKLKDDPELYVRRSVANNLNDIGKDNPQLLTATVARWMENVTPERRTLIKHALRSQIKAGDSEALAILGFSGGEKWSVRDGFVTPQAAIGGSVQITFTVVNEDLQTQRAVVDFRVHFVKANGKTSAKVFKLKDIELPAQGTQRMEKSVALHQMTTRKHFVGYHKVDALINGTAHPLGGFDLQ